MSADTGSRGAAPAVTGILCAVAAASGAAALLFETLWFQVAGLAFGNGVWASSIVLASFMAGLAGGNWLSGRVGDRLASPIRFYAWLELTVGAAGAALVWGLPGLTGVLAELFAPLRDSPWLLNALRLPLAFALMMVPATAMGATLPLLVRAARPDAAGYGRTLGLLYGWNTLGAVAGAMLGEALLIGALGVRGSALAAAGLDAAAALGALALARGLAEPPPSPAGPLERRLGADALRLLAAAFLAGLIFLALEVVWFRFLSLFVYGTSLVFATLLAAVLAGIGLGGLAGARLARSEVAPSAALPGVALLAGSLVLLSWLVFPRVLQLALPDPAHGSAAAFLPHVLLIALPLMFPAAFLSGLLFTLLGAAAKQTIGAEARTTGLLTLANTVGAALGSLVGGFLLLPRVGIEGSLLGLALGYAAVAALSWPPRAAGANRFGAVAAACLALLAALFPHGVLREVYLPHPTLPYRAPDSQIAAVREGLVETLVYLRVDRFGQPLFFRLFTDGLSMTANNTHSRRYMKAFVYLPAAIHPAPRRALLVSYGIGSTARALLDTPGVEEVDVVDISRDILTMSSLVWPTQEQDPLRDPRVRVHVEDGRFFLQTSRERYDLITGEPPPPKYAGVVSLYTREYFALVRERLAEYGIVSYWLPVHDLLESDATAILRGFCDVFADCTLWSGAGLDWILLGTRGGLPPVSEEQFGRQWRTPAAAEELVALGFERPELLGATFLAGAERLAELTRDVAPLVDDFPKRLSAEPVVAPQAGLFDSLLKVESAAQEFRRSAFVRQVWPGALRVSTLGSYRWQALVNGQFLGKGSSNEALHALLTRTELRVLPLWLMGSDVDEQRLARRAGGQDAERADLARVRGVGALAERDYPGAARWFHTAQELDPSGVRARQFEIFALCMAGRIEPAAELARQLVRSLGDRAVDDGAYWSWLHATFGLPDPRGS